MHRYSTLAQLSSTSKGYSNCQENEIEQPKGLQAISIEEKKNKTC